MKNTSKKDIVLKQVFGKRKRAKKGFSGAIQKGTQKTWGFVKQLKPIHSIAIVIVAVFILQAIIPQNVLWPWFQGRAAELTGNWRQESWEGGGGQGETSQDTDKYDADDGRISVLSDFAGKAGFVSYANRSYIAVGDSAGKPAVAMDGSGRTLGVWVDQRNGKEGLYARLVDSKGRALPLQGGNQDVLVSNNIDYADVEGTISFDQPAVAFDPISKRFVAVWSYAESGGGDSPDVYGVYLRTIRWAGSGLSLGTMASVAGDGLISQRNPHLAVRYRSSGPDVSNNEMVVTWQAEYQNEAYFKVMAVGYLSGSDGTLTASGSGAIQISKTFIIEQINDYLGLGYSGCSGPMVAITESGKAMIVWTADYDTGGEPEGDKDVRGRVYSTSEFWPAGGED
ncbi:hypothetical protein E3J85_02270 [Patescibacteria group bacterium]|nr:MAG: hypothetical protein E3J85_02270 [Patescibacteria group bacterium]